MSQLGLHTRRTQAGHLFMLYMTPAISGDRRQGCPLTESVGKYILYIIASRSLLFDQFVRFRRKPVLL